MTENAIANIHIPDKHEPNEQAILHSEIDFLARIHVINNDIAGGATDLLLVNLPS